MRRFTLPAFTARFHTVARNTVWLLAAQGVTRVVSYSYTIALARVLGVSEFGEYVFLVTYITYFGLLADFGLSRMVTRDIARHPEWEARHVGNTIALKFVLSLGAYVLAVGALAATGADGERLALMAVVGLALLPGPILSTADAVFTAREEMRLAALVQIVATVAVAALGVGALAIGWELWGAVIAFTAANAVPVAAMLWLMRLRGVALRPRFEMDFWSDALRGSAAYAGLAALSAIYVRIDTLMLTWMVDTEATGVYNAAYRLSEVFAILPGVITVALFPSMSRLHLESKEQLRRVFRATMLVMAIAGVGVGVFLLVAAGPLIDVLYGDEFDGSVTPLRILAASLLLRFVNTPNSAILASGDRIGRLFWFSLVTAGLNVLLNLYFIPRWDSSGAAATTVISDGVSVLLFTVVVVRYLSPSRAS